MARLDKVLCKLGTKLESSTPGKDSPRAYPVMPGSPEKDSRDRKSYSSREDAVRLSKVASFEVFVAKK